MKKFLVKLGMVSALTMALAMLTPVDAQAQTKTETTADKGTSSALPQELAPNGEVILSGSGTEEDPYIIGEPGVTRRWLSYEEESYPIWWNGGVTGGGIKHTFWYLNI